MDNFIFENRTKVYFGKGCVREFLVCEAKKYGGKVMLAYGGGSVKKNGIYDEIISLLRDADLETVDFPGIMANPTYEKVLEGARLAREENVGLILGVGGGSVMDCCKAISLAAVYDGDIWKDYWARNGVIGFEPLPLGVVVTVTGTGSEMNGDRNSKEEVIAYAVDKYGIDKDRAIMIGDRKHDIIGANKNNIKSIGVLYGYGNIEEFSTASAVAENVEDIIGVIDSI